jgi:hypothetical protein
VLWLWDYRLLVAEPEPEAREQEERCDGEAYE